MILVSTFVELVQQLSPVMTAPTFVSFVRVLTGWVFARRRTVTRMILAADAVEEKHHSAFSRRAGIRRRAVVVGCPGAGRLCHDSLVA